MLAGLKVSSLVQKCVFYRPELTGKWGPHGIEILNFCNAKMKVWARYLSASEKFYLALLENTMDYVVLSYH